MKTETGVILGIAVIVIIVLAAVVGYIAVQPRSQTSNMTIQSQTSSEVTDTITTTSTYQTTQTSQTTASIKSASTSNSGEGTMAIQMTDPPVAAAGVSSAIVTYNGIALHNASATSTTGWVEISATGTINLMSSANVSQTVASTKIQTGVYDKVQINITSGAVTYNNHSYVAAIASGSLTANMQQGAQVNASSPTQAIMDLRTFIINCGNSTSPQFIISATAKATAEPQSAVTSASLQVGAKASLEGQAWWNAFVDQTSTETTITSATLTATSFDMAIANDGNATADIQTVIITPISSSTSTEASLPDSLEGSAVFTLSSSGSLQQSNSLEGVALLTSTGAQVTASSSTTLTYTGLISLAFGLTSSLHLSGVVSGQQYLVTCMGANTYSSAIVVAQ